MRRTGPRWNVPVRLAELVTSFALPGCKPLSLISHLTWRYSSHMTRQSFNFQLGLCSTKVSNVVSRS